MQKDIIYNEDCMKMLERLEDQSIDCIICDLPYGATQCEWDKKLPLDKLWKQYKRVIKKNGNIILFGSGMFTYELIHSNKKHYKYKLIWKKNVPTGMAGAKSRPMHYYEEICVFNYGKNWTYNPIMKPRYGKGKSCYKYRHYCGKSNHINLQKKPRIYDIDYVQPSDILEFNVVPNRGKKLHPTQKPVELLEYLIRTYTNEGDTILDNCIGCGTTAVASISTGRHFIGCEINKEFFDIANEQVKIEQEKIKLF